MSSYQNQIDALDKDNHNLRENVYQRGLLQDTRHHTMSAKFAGLESRVDAIVKTLLGPSQAVVTLQAEVRQLQRQVADLRVWTGVIGTVGTTVASRGEPWIRHIKVPSSWVPAPPPARTTPFPTGQRVAFQDDREDYDGIRWTGRVIPEVKVRLSSVTKRPLIWVQKDHDGAIRACDDRHLLTIGNL